jgi:hypothetical protein
VVVVLPCSSSFCPFLFNKPLNIFFMLILTYSHILFQYVRSIDLTLSREGIVI